MDAEGRNLRDLLQQAEQLTADMIGEEELPRIRRNLHQMIDAGDKIYSRVMHASSREAADVKASLLLGSKGYDMPKISQKLETLSVAKTFEPLEPVRDVDIQAFLRNERENAILSVIEESRKQTFADVETSYFETLENEWEQEKQRILNALIGSSGEFLSFPQDNEVSISEVDMKTRSSLNNVEMAYARQVYKYNEKAIQGGTLPNMVDLFTEVAKKTEDQTIEEVWSMVQHITEVPLTASDSTVSLRTCKDSQLCFINQARKYLEGSYKKYIEKTVYSNLQQAKLGGVPGTVNLIKSFLNITLPAGMPGLEEIYVEDQPIWPMIYYCLRCGDLQAALHVTNVVQQQLDEFPAFLTEFVHSPLRRLSHSSDSKLKLLYRRSVRTSPDPYKRRHTGLQLLSVDPSDPTPMKRLNFARLIKMYTRKFEATDLREALQYFYFLRSLKGTSGENLFVSCISELALETREYELLLGRMQADGCRKPGCVEKFQEDTVKIVEFVAKNAEDRGLFEDAVKLYDLCKFDENVLEIMNKMLSQVVSQPPAQLSSRDRLRSLATSIAERYKVQGHTGTQSTAGTFFLLLDLMTFFDLYHNRKLQEAIDTMQQLKLIPLGTQDIEEKINSFRQLAEEVRRVMPDILLAVMAIMQEQHKAVRQPGFQQVSISSQLYPHDDGGRQKYVEYLRKQARGLITFAGMLPYRLPGDTNARLVQMEVLLN
ncbi:PREDICTED: nuclear pore complex protein Nup93-like [Priapulus caudatus]|uniref:Nuclear pore protein n=1 Tax=Priapulus caudatus TaxID=37621 RepID=A0ABM1F8K0_PRICU|nr:PREDICTED: nuclear pore complex protein Nup93-like [Priapulus caudatus]